ncbi:MAG: histidine kinase [Tannerella sp.]|nr:histidine kinase [Tannerella sp.]
MSNKLTGWNDSIDKELNRGVPLREAGSKEVSRISVMDLSGNILYDSEAPNIENVENHATRKEVKQAIEKGSGYDVRRRSVLTGDVYFYSAKKYDNYVIRSAIPYDPVLVSNLKVEPLYIFVTVVILLIFIVIFYNVMRHLGGNINRLNDFVAKVENGEDVNEYPMHFSNDEVGEISRHVVQIYNHLQKTKHALVSEQRRLLEQQEQQSRIKKQLTQNIAHELKTPVSSIQGYLETIISNKELSPEMLDNFIEKCYQQSARLSSLLHDISTLTRIDEAPGLIEKAKVDLSELITEVCGDVAFLLKEKKIKVHNRTEALSLWCYGNRSLLYSVFRNLFDNTIAYAGEGVDIYIDCNTENPGLYYFSYSDNGVGIPEEHLERIFERFYRIDKGRSRRIGGTGLGLSIVKNAVLLHGGTITAKRRLAGGLEFVFSIKR